MCSKKINIFLIIFAIPFIASLLFVTVSSPSLLVLTNINFSDIKQTCLHYKEYSTNYGLNQCFLPATAILNNLFALALVVTSVIIMILSCNIFNASKKKWKFQVDTLKDEVESLQTTNGDLLFENQRLGGKNHVQQVPRDNVVNRNVFVSPNANRETDQLSVNLPNYGTVVREFNAENKVSHLRFPTIDNN